MDKKQGLFGPAIPLTEDGKKELEKLKAKILKNWEVLEGK